MPEAANKIKHLINGEEIKIDEPKVLSDDTLIEQYTQFLRSTQFDVTGYITYLIIIQLNGNRCA